MHSARVLAVVFACVLLWVVVVPMDASAGESRTPVDPVTVARQYVERNAPGLGLTPSDIAETALSSVVPSRHTGVTHVYLQQRYSGIEVFGGLINVNVQKSGSVISAGNRFVADVAASGAGQSVQQGPVEAVEEAALHLGLVPTKPFEIVEFKGGADQAATVSDGGVAAQEIPVRLVWLPAEGFVRLAWHASIDVIGGEHWWNAFVDAGTGGYLGGEDLVAHDNVDHIASALGRPGTNDDGDDDADDDDDEDDRPSATYRVFPMPVESPSHGRRSLVEDPADRRASPFGWHDTNGAKGAEFTTTQGNNVHAYTDVDANGVPDVGSSPDGGSRLRFDFPLDLTQEPSGYRPAAVTNLFYWNNIMHDVTYRYGFDEAAGNFQVNNYARGGLGADDVRAEAQDGSGTNNANFLTPVDGLRPRMQMFVWSHPQPNIVTVGAGPIAGDYTASRATFGPQLSAIPPVTALVALVNDGVSGGTPTDGCEPYTGFAGKIAMVDRGLCTFVAKVVNAQGAGAVGVIVANNVPGNPITMGFNPPLPPLTVPVVMVSLDRGTLFKANLPFTATLRADPARSINRDSDLDAGVIAHEYTHGISNRLTGGPATVACLGNAEQMGEGWSDWFALALTARRSDRSTTARGIGTYVIYETPQGGGIRPTPYSTDMAVNPSTYASVADTTTISQPHGIGYVWATMLWEMYWNLVERHGFNRDFYDEWDEGGNNLAIQLVIDGMKFQPCRPGFVDGRDAILNADNALTGGKNQCEIWRAFAKRGLGVNAQQGNPNSRLDGVQNFDLPPSCLDDDDDDDDGDDDGDDDRSGHDGDDHGGDELVGLREEDES